MNKTKAKFNLVRTDEEADKALVQLIAPMMDAKLERKRKLGRGGWWDRNNASNKELAMMLEDHVAKCAPFSGKPPRVEDLIDVANLAAMMALRIELYGDEA